MRAGSGGERDRSFPAKSSGVGGPAKPDLRQVGHGVALEDCAYEARLSGLTLLCLAQGNEIPEAIECSLDLRGIGAVQLPLTAFDHREHCGQALAKKCGRYRRFTFFERLRRKQVCGIQLSHVSLSQIAHVTLVWITPHSLSLSLF